MSLNFGIRFHALHTCGSAFIIMESYCWAVLKNYQRYPVSKRYHGMAVYSSERSNHYIQTYLS